MAEKETELIEPKDIEISIERESPEQVIFKKALESLNDKLKNKEISVGNIMLIVQSAMEVVEITKVKGEQQKDLAVKLIKKIIIDAPISDSKEKLLIDMIEGGVVGSTIDLVVAASQGRLNINVVSEVAIGCCEFIMKKLKK
jgi:hypothetical protein